MIKMINTYDITENFIFYMHLCINLILPILVKWSSLLVSNGRELSFENPLKIPEISDSCFEETFSFNFFEFWLDDIEMPCQSTENQICWYYNIK